MSVERLWSFRFLAASSTLSLSLTLFFFVVAWKHLVGEDDILDNLEFMVF